MPTPDDLERRATVAIVEGSPLHRLIEAHRADVAPKPAPDSAAWWQEVAQGLGVTIHIMRSERDDLLAACYATRHQLLAVSALPKDPQHRANITRALNLADKAIAKAEGR